MTTPALMPLPNGAPPAAPQPAAPSPQAGAADAAAADSRESPAFSRVLADQHRSTPPSAPPSSDRPAKGGERPGRPRQDETEQTAEKDGAAPTLAQQALDIAIQATAQLRAEGRSSAAREGQSAGRDSAPTSGVADAREAASAPAARTVDSSRARAAAGVETLPAHAGRDANGRQPRGGEFRSASRDVTADTAGGPGAAPSAAAAPPTPATTAVSALMEQAGAAASRASGHQAARTAHAAPSLPEGKTADILSGRGSDRAGPDDTPARQSSQPAAMPASFAHAAAAAEASLAAAATGHPSPGALHDRPTDIAMQVATPVHQPQWGADLGRQLVALGQSADGLRHTAELRLDPPDLGPLRVSLQISDGIAQASFVSPHAAVRHAIESAMPQLQQSLAQAGISLGQANVSDQQSQQEWSQSHGASPRRLRGDDGDLTIAEAGGDATAPRSIGNALVDTFA